MKSLLFVLGWILLQPLGAGAQVAAEDAPINDSEEISLAAEAERPRSQLILEAGLEDVASHEEDAEPVSEKDITLFQKEAAAPIAKSLGGGGATLLTVGIGFALMLGGFYLMRKWVRKTAGSNTPLKIKIIGQHYLGPKKSLAVVRVAGESILIGITDHNISCIKALSLMDEELPSPEPGKDFSASLMEQDLNIPQEDAENFAMAPLTEIKDRVSTKLRDMREI